MSSARPIGSVRAHDAERAPSPAARPRSWGNNPTGPGGCQAGASDIACPSTDYNFVARNITNMAQQAANFLDYAAAQGTPWMLYVGFGDSHRCGGDVVGEFCEKFGLDQQGRSTIPDWTPFHIAPADVQVPFWIQDTPAAREDLAKMYTAKNRMDQGVGLILALLEARGLANSTLVVYTADNGAPFAAGKTNMYEVATSEPMIAFAPGAARAGVRSQELASTLDLLPTWLAWAGVPLPSYSLFGPVTYTGRSLLPFITGAAAEDGADGDEAAAFPALRHRLLMSAAEAAAATRPLRAGATRRERNARPRLLPEPRGAGVLPDAQRRRRRRVERLALPPHLQHRRAAALPHRERPLRGACVPGPPEPHARRRCAVHAARDRGRASKRPSQLPRRCGRAPAAAHPSPHPPLLTAQLRRTGTVTSARTLASRARRLSSSTLCRTRWS